MLAIAEAIAAVAAKSRNSITIMLVTHCTHEYLDAGRHDPLSLLGLLSPPSLLEVICRKVDRLPFAKLISNSREELGVSGVPSPLPGALLRSRSNEIATMPSQSSMPLLPIIHKRIVNNSGLAE